MPECPGAWDCGMLEGATMEVMAYYDSSNDGYLNPEDQIDEEHYEIMMEYCD